MIRRSVRKDLRGLWLAVGLGVCLAAVEAASAAPPARGLVLSFPRGAPPVRLELRIEIGGQAVSAVWDETFARLLTFYDRNSDHALDRVEASRLPAPFALRQILWGRFSTFAGEAPSLAELDTSQDGVVTTDELARYYRGAGLGDVLVGAGWPVGTQRLNDALLAHIDVNRDGRTDRAEWEGAAGSLRRLDLNDDELIGAGELASGISYPGALGSHLVQPRPAEIKPPEHVPPWSFEILPTPGRDAGPMPSARGPSVDESSRSAVWSVHLAGSVALPSALRTQVGEPPASGRLTLDGGNWRFCLRRDDGKLAEQVVAARQQFAAQFQEADVDSSRILSAEEIRTAKARLLQPLAASADRNGDGDLSESEFRDWFELQAQVAKGLVLLTVLDHGSGLFELLDEDRDGALSVRELTQAASRLAAVRCLTDTGFVPTNLPRQFMAIVSHGQPRSPLGHVSRVGPDWFAALDRNSDGEVSIREWVSELKQFRSLDVDGDGRLSAAEAEHLGRLR